jgi:hypothetical protein
MMQLLACSAGLIYQLVEYKIGAATHTLPTDHTYRLLQTNLINNPG